MFKRSDSRYRVCRCLHLFPLYSNLYSKVCAVSSEFPQVTLVQANLVSKVAHGHPWLYADALRHKGVRAGAGDVVDVVDPKGTFLARGIFDPDSPIRVRVWTTSSQVAVDDELLAVRIKEARKRRPFPDAQTTGFRLLHGEGDGVPGVVCDVYGEVGVMRPDGVAAERWVEPAMAVISRSFGQIKHWAIRRSAIHTTHARPQSQWLTEAPAGGNVVPFLEHGVQYVCDVIEGQKTGFFLDQRENRARVARLSPGKRVLNLFGYTGGFSLAAALAGAARTTTVDLAAPALEMAKENFRLNGLEPLAHEFVAKDVFEFLEAYKGKVAPFDVAVCDPPSFVHKRRDLPRATDAYIRLFGALLEAMASGSTVALASCSSHIHRDDFVDILARAAHLGGCQLVMQGVFGADLDHPTLPAFPEGDYLQCVIASVTK